MSQFKVDLGFQYKNLRNRSRSLKEIERESAARGLQYKDLPADFFNALYQSHPQLEGIDSENLYNQVVRAVINSPNFQRIRQQTKNNLHWSAVGASILLDEVSRQLANDLQDEEPPETEQSNSDVQNENNSDQSDSDQEMDSSGNDEGDNQEPDESESDVGNSDSDNDDEESEGSGDNSDSDENSQSDEMDNEDSDSSDNDSGNSESESETEEISNDSSDDGDMDMPGNGDLSPDNEQNLSEDSDNEEDFGDLDEEETEIDNSDAPIDDKIQEALNKASEKIDNMLRGLQQGEANAVASLDEAKLTEQLVALGRNRQLARILQLVGRLRLNNRFLAAMQVGEPEETIGITQGREIRHTMPQDLSLLMGNEQEFRVFARKFVNGELLQRQYKSNSRPGKGPMIVCVDHSGSMDGEREQWASVISTAMYLQCLKEKRPFAAVIFASTAQTIVPKTQHTIDADFMNTVLSIRVGGGTNFELAWTKAVQFMRQQPNKQWRDADIVFITDGQAYFHKEQWLLDKDKYNVRLITFMIGTSEAEAKSIWTEEELQTRYRNSAVYHRNLIGKPKYEEFNDLIETSDAMVFIEKLDEDSEKQAFEVVKNEKQRRGEFVRK